MGQAPQPPAQPGRAATGPAILEAILRLEGKIDQLIQAFQDYAIAAHNERQALQRFIETDVQLTLVQLRELARKNIHTTTDLRKTVQGALQF